MTLSQRRILSKTDSLKELVGLLENSFPLLQLHVVRLQLRVGLVHILHVPLQIGECRLKRVVLEMHQDAAMVI